MKKFICMAMLMAFIHSASFAQTNETMETYCEIVGRAALSLTGKIKIEIDFGQENKVFEGINNDMLKDPVTGKPMKFNSMVDALNHMAAQGWLFVNAYQITDTGNNTTYHYIMRRVVPKK
ncbi:MAG TPA: hypothetical protein VD905_18700 [Flavobacteriales bacterium]|nr:hypothetical protein [Flavobacteriales bacterium]